ncbi:MAG TPA: metallophosphoesterase, partial [Patescibacteria group bacterium]|nr:metallophosphoesterase [Patescibacteria group bacterium]
MPKKFIFILVIFQLVLSFLHWLLYLEALAFFPALQAHSSGLLIAIMAMSVSFLVFSASTHFREQKTLTVGYVLAAIWLVWAMYFSIFGAVALLGYLAFGGAIGYWGWAVFAVSSALTLYGLINARIARLVTYTVRLPNLPAAWKNQTAIMASDLHLGQILKKHFARKLIKLINAQAPRIVFIPGDFYDGVHTNFQELADEFKKLAAPWGVFFSSGNHEMLAGYGVCEQAVRNAGLRVLEDENVDVQGVQILGLAYRSETDESVAERLGKMSIDPKKPSILLKHVPDHLGPVTKAGVSLQLSGHTHLGQVWPFRYITKKIFKSFDYGLKAIGASQV